MIPVSFIWDTRERSVYIKWNGFFSFGRKEGKVLKKMFGLTIPIPPSAASGKIHSPRMRWVYFKEAFSFLREWELKKVEGSLSFPDPMVNGLLYGWLSALETRKVDRKVNPSTPRPKGWGLLRVDPERHLLSCPKGRGLGAVERVNLTINFLGENWCSGEATISPKSLFDHLTGWIFPLLREMKGAAHKHH